MSAISGWLKMSKELQELTHRSCQHGTVLELDEVTDVHKEALEYFKYTKGDDNTGESPFDWRIRKSSTPGEWTWLFSIRDDLIAHLRGKSLESVTASS